MSEERAKVTIEELRELLHDLVPLEEGLIDVPFVSYKAYNPE